MKRHLGVINKLFLIVGIVCLYSCTGYEKKYACYDYYQIRVMGDSMLLISFTKNVETGKDKQDTTFLYQVNGQFFLNDGSLLFSNKTDSTYLRKSKYRFQDEKQVISIYRKDGLNYSTIRTFFENYSKTYSFYRHLKKRLPNITWRLFKSTTFIYDDNYRIVNIVQDGAWFFPLQSPISSDGYMLKNRDIITCQKEGDEMTIVFHLNQKDGMIKEDCLRLHLVNGEYLSDDCKLFLSSEKDTTYSIYKNERKDTLFQMVIGHTNNQKKQKYSIYWDIKYGDEVSKTVPKAIIDEYAITEIVQINERHSILYDGDYNIVGIYYGVLGFFPKASP